MADIPPKRMAVRKRPAAERGLGKAGGDTQVLLPAYTPRNLDVPEKERTITRRLKRIESLLTRTPLILEVVSALSVGPSPIRRPDLIGRTIAGGPKIRGATSTADVGLRSSPTGFAVKAHKSIVPAGRYSKSKKRKKSKK